MKSGKHKTVLKPLRGSEDQESEGSHEAERQPPANDRQRGKRQRETTNQQGQQREKRQRQQITDDVSPEGSPPPSSSSEDQSLRGGGRGRGNQGGRGNGGRGGGRGRGNRGGRGNGGRSHGRGNGRGAGNGGRGPEDASLDKLMREIDKLQRSGKPTLPKATVIRVIRFMVSSYTRVNRFTAEAMQIIHEALELAIVELFEDSSLLTKHRRRVTTKSSDIMLARQLSGRSFF